jgi:hypothetical protein
MICDCAACRHFDTDPARLERRLPGLSALSSAYGTTRGRDGTCLRHDRLVPPTALCNHFAVRLTVIDGHVRPVVLPGATDA